MKNFNRNNLDKASSPYLVQHKDNPINWQEWDEETLKYAKENNKLILVSIGYSTCHWCHVMAHEAFAEKEIAEFLNENFVAIKVDREQRPDIDQYFMELAVQIQGQGGWPLNVILSPDQNPLYVATYLPIKAKHGLPGFKDKIEEIIDWYNKNKDKVREFMPSETLPQVVEEGRLVNNIVDAFDGEWAGFGYANKFPPHNTLLFLMSYFEATGDERLSPLITATLNVMSMRGLHDHLQGGFYRYCVDREWTIPHFEKMLYDQAMHIWTYSIAYKLFEVNEYKTIVEKIIQCLEETFEEDGWFYSAHDAETEHVEGKTYLWSKKELADVLSKDEFEDFVKLYEISDEGNFEGANHLLKKENNFLPKTEEKLLKLRKNRPQPFVDKKIVTSWNALAGIGLVMAYRWTANESAYKKAEIILEKLLLKHYVGGKLAHSSLNGTLQDQEFLEDYASVLLLATFIYEETGKFKDIIKDLLKKMKHFYDKKWYENPTVKDFMRMPAKFFDHPTPSSISLAEFAELRANRILENSEQADLQYRQPLENDFHNMVTFLSDGNLHEIHRPKKIAWKSMPINSMQIPGEKYLDCYRRQCRMFITEGELIKSI